MVIYNMEANPSYPFQVNNQNIFSSLYQTTTLYTVQYTQSEYQFYNETTNSLSLAYLPSITVVIRYVNTQVIQSFQAGNITFYLDTSYYIMQPCYGDSYLPIMYNKSLENNLQCQPSCTSCGQHNLCFECNANYSTINSQTKRCTCDVPINMTILRTPLFNYNIIQIEFTLLNVLPGYLGEITYNFLQNYQMDTNTRMRVENTTTTLLNTNETVNKTIITLFQVTDFTIQQLTNQSTVQFEVDIFENLVTLCDRPEYLEFSTQLIKDQNYTQLNNCPENCQFCSQAGHCLLCDFEYFQLVNLTSNEMSCLLDCPNEFYTDYIKINNYPIQSCQPCQDGCANCSVSECFDCKTGYNQLWTFEELTLRFDLQCFEQCPPSTFLNSSQICDNCQQGCINCIDATNCIKCDACKVLQNNQCITRNDTYGDYLSPVIFTIEGNSQPCSGLGIEGCLVCDRKEKTVLTCGNPMCISCDVGYVLDNINGVCIQYNDTFQCPERSYFNSLTYECESCGSSCLACDNTTLQCTQCNNTVINFRNGTNGCVDSCPEGYYYDDNLATCEVCSAGCQYCYNSSQCQECFESQQFLHQGKCYTQCPQFTYLNQSNCIDCAIGCAVCETSDTCLECQQNFKLIESNTTQDQDYIIQKALGTCIPLTNACPSGTYEVNNTCLKCESGCAQCNATDCFVQCTQSCQDCVNSGTTCNLCMVDEILVLPSFSCTGSCTSGQYYEESPIFACNPCSDGCTTCNSYNNCTQCSSGLLLHKQIDEQGLPFTNCENKSCQYLKHYYNDTTKACDLCAPGCVYCEDSLNCAYCDIYTQQNGSKCACDFRYDYYLSSKYNELTIYTYHLQWNKSIPQNVSIPCDSLFNITIQTNISNIAIVNNFTCELAINDTFYYPQVSDQFIDYLNNPVKDFMTRIRIQNFTNNALNDFKNRTYQIYLNETNFKQDCQNLNLLNYNVAFNINEYFPMSIQNFTNNTNNTVITPPVDPYPPVPYEDDPSFDFSILAKVAMRCQPIQVYLINPVGFRYGIKNVFWQVEILTNYDTYTQNMTLLRSLIKNAIDSYENIANFSLPSLATEVISKQVTFRITAVAKNNLNLQVIRYIDILVKGQIDFVDLVITPSIFNIYASDGLTYKPQVYNKLCSTFNQSAYYIPSNSNLNCTLLNYAQKVLVQNLINCSISSTNGLTNNNKYYINFTASPNSLQPKLFGLIQINTLIVYPTCTLNGGGTLTVDKRNLIQLNASVVNNDIGTYSYKWQSQPIGQNSICNFQGSFTLRSAFNITQNTLAYNELCKFTMLILNNNQKSVGECSVYIQTLPQLSNCTLIDINIQHNNENPLNYMDPTLNHEFICNPNDYQSGTITYQWYVSVSGSSDNLLDILSANDIKAQGQTLDIYKSALKLNRDYLIRCNVQGSTGVCGSITQLYTTKNSTTIQAIFSVSPTVGNAFSTPFTFKIQKLSAAKMKCEFGIIDPYTNDYLIRSSTANSKQLTSDDEIFTDVLQGSEIGNITTYARCIDAKNLQGVYKSQVKVINGTNDRDQEVKLYQIFVKGQDVQLNTSETIQYYKQLDYNKNQYSSNITNKGYQVIVGSISNINSTNLTIEDNNQLSTILQKLASQINQSSSLANDTVLVNSLDKAITNLITGGNSYNFTNGFMETSYMNLANVPTMQPDTFTKLSQSMDMMMNINDGSNTTNDTNVRILRQVSFGADRIIQQLPSDGTPYHQETDNFVLNLRKISTDNVTKNGISFNISTSDSTTSLSFQLPPNISLSNSDNLAVRTIITDPNLVNGTSLYKSDKEFASKLFTISICASNNTIGKTSSQSIQTVKVQNLTSPIMITLPLTDSRPDNSQTEKRCVYYDELTLQWVELEGLQQRSDTNITCYTTHLTTFTVQLLPTKISTAPLFSIRHSFIPYILAFLNFLLIIMFTVGCVCDTKGHNQIEQQYQIVKSQKTSNENKTEQDESPLEAKQVVLKFDDNNMDTPISPIKNQNRKNEKEMKISSSNDVLQFEQQVNNYKRQNISDTELISPESSPRRQNSLGQKSQFSVCRHFLLSWQIYHRILSCFFTEQGKFMVRPVKCIANVAQLFIILLLCGLWILLVPQIIFEVAFVIIIGIMRVVQILLNLWVNSNQSIQGINIAKNMCLLLILLCGIGVINWIVIIIGAALGNKIDFNAWTLLFICICVFEILIWDFLIMPILIICMRLCGLKVLFSNKFDLIPIEKQSFGPLFVKPLK